MIIKRCKHCGNQVFMLNDSGVPMMCCGEAMQELVAGSVDAAKEKHVPFVTVNEDTLQVAVGEVAHPMTPEHSIQWIAVVQASHIQFAKLTPADEPKASFPIAKGMAYKVYEYCNLHGLWLTEGQA